MNSVEDPSSDEHLAALLAAYEGALQTGLGPSPEGLATAVSLAGLARLKRAGACLHLLNQVWCHPHPADDEVTSESPFRGHPIRFGRFWLVSELGRGGCGIVFLAFDPDLGRPVALKVPRPEVLVAPRLRDLFLREGRVTAGLDHPNVVPIYEYGEVGPICYLVSAYCAGPTLAQWLDSRSEPVPVSWAAALLTAAAEGVAHAHARGIVHRDLKPANILLDPLPSAVGLMPRGVAEPEYVPRLTDFGSARLLELEPDEIPGQIRHGTPLYRAPEQANGGGRESTPQTDVYALGVILYELLTGRLPLRETGLDSLEGVPDGLAPPRLLRPDIPAVLEAICLKCLENESRSRYATAGNLVVDLRGFLAADK